MANSRVMFVLEDERGDFMKDIIMILIVGYGSWFLCVFSFSQIFGSFQHFRTRGFLMTAITTIIHTIVILLAIIVILKWFARFPISLTYIPCIIPGIASIMGFTQ